MFLRQGRQDVKRKAISDHVLCQSEMEGEKAPDRSIRSSLCPCFIKVGTVFVTVKQRTQVFKIVAVNITFTATFWVPRLLIAEFFAGHYILRAVRSLGLKRAVM